MKKAWIVALRDKPPKLTHSVQYSSHELFDRCVEALTPSSRNVKKRPPPTIRKFSWEN